MSLPYFIQFNDLKERQIVNSRSHLKLLTEKANFPRGTKLGPRIRGWTEAEILDWIAGCQPVGE